jgi:PKHD-type hydroxylase
MQAIWDAKFGLLSDEMCDKIITEALKYPEQDGLVGQDTYDEGFRKSKIRHLDLLLSKEISDLVWFHVQMSNKQFYNFDIHSLEPLQYGEYHADYGGHFDWHRDFYWHINTPEVYQRKLTVSIQLSDPKDYDGGDFEIELDDKYSEDDDSGVSWSNLEKHWPRARGTIIIFPAWMKHRVTPVTRGVRKSLTTWVDGPKFR